MFDFLKFLKGETKGVGIDIGTSSVKVVELKKKTGEIKLSTYGEFRKPLSPDRAGPLQTSSLKLLEEEVAQIIRSIKTEAQLKFRKAAMSLPVFSSFFTTITLPPMPPEEVANAISFQARQYIPVPIPEVVLDWSILKPIEAEKRPQNIQVLVVAVPNEIVNRYVRIAELSDIELAALEVETFGLVRALIKQNESNFLVIDFGANSTNVSIIQRKSIRFSHSLDLSSTGFTKLISQSLDINFRRAEELKKEQGLKGEEENIVAPVILPLIDKIIFDIKKIVANFRRKQSEEFNIEKVIITGGMANLPGLKDYLSEKIEKEVEIGDPFLEIKTPPILSPLLKEIGPSFAVAIGLAMREL